MVNDTLRAKIHIQYQPVIVIFIGLLCLDLVGLLFLKSESLRVTLTDILGPLIGLFASGVLFYTAWKIRPVSKKFALAWFFMAFGCLSWALGDVSWAVLELILHTEPYPSIADFFYLIYYPLVIIGFLHIPYRRLNFRERLKNGLDLTIVFLASAMVYWNFLIGPLVVFEDIDWLTVLISLAYPIFDWILFAGLMFLLYRKQSLLSRPALFCLATSIVVQIVFDTIYGLQSIAGTYESGTLLDLSWQIGFALFGLVGIIQLQSKPVEQEQAETALSARVEPYTTQKINLWLAFTPYLWLAAAWTLLVYSEFYRLPMHYRSIAIGIGLMIVLILARQLIAIIETTRLSQQLAQELYERQKAQELLRKSYEELEERVRQRTVELVKANQQLNNEVRERKHAEGQIQISLQEKEVLLKEIHHRVKNNLQIISSMLSLQAGQAKNPEMVNTLMDSQTRIQSMALIHEKLYQSTDLGKVDFAGYLESLAAFLSRSYSSSQKEIYLRLDTEPLALPIDLAVPCGLIVNELVTNAYKHAFPNREQGQIQIGFHKNPEDSLQLVIHDDGIGIPEGIDIRNSPTLGMQMVYALVNQIEGKLEHENHFGSRFTLTFANTQVG